MLQTSAGRQINQLHDDQKSIADSHIGARAEGNSIAYKTLGRKERRYLAQVDYNGDAGVSKIAQLLNRTPAMGEAQGPPTPNLGTYAKQIWGNNTYFNKEKAKLGDVDNQYSPYKMPMIPTAEARTNAVLYAPKLAELWIKQEEQTGKFTRSPAEKVALIKLAENFLKGSSDVRKSIKGVDQFDPITHMKYQGREVQLVETEPWTLLRETDFKWSNGSWKDLSCSVQANHVREIASSNSRVLQTQLG